MMAKSTFEVAYTGPDLVDGSMEITELAPALLAIAAVFSEASEILYPDHERVSLSIKATEEGSFLVQLFLSSVDGLWDTLTGFMTSTGITAIVNLQQLVLSGGGTIGVIETIRYLRNRKILNQYESPDRPGNVILECDDGRIEIPAEVMLLLASAGIRRRARQIVAPLTRDGVEAVTFTDSFTELVIVKEDVEAFDVPAEAETPMLDQTNRAILQVVSPVLTEDRKWRLTDGSTSFLASIEDELFLERVHSGEEAFRAGDTLTCRLRTVTTRRGSQLHSDYSVVTVIGHQGYKPQLELD